MQAILLWTLLASLFVAAPSRACTNGIYVTAATLFAGFSDESLGRWKAGRIDHVYVYRLNVADAADRQRLERAIEALRERMPGTTLIGMIGRKADPQMTLARARDLWSLGFDGVQIDFEPIASGDRTLEAVLATLRDAKPKGKLVSLASYLIQDDSLRAADKPLLVWDSEYYRKLVSLVDDLMVMNYDTAIRDRDTYVRSTSIQTRRLSNLVAGTRVRLNIGVITDVPGRSGMFDRKAENFSSGLEGIRQVWPTCPDQAGITLFTADGMTSDYWRELANWMGEDSAQDTRR